MQAGQRRDRAGKPTPPRLRIGHPVDEEDDVPRFLVHQGREDLQHFPGQKFRLPRDLEKAKSQEGIETFAEAKVLEARFDIGAEIFHGSFRRIEIVFVDHHADQIGMPRLLLALQSKRGLHNRIADGRSEGSNDRAGAPFGVKYLLPKGHGLESAQAIGIQHRPRQRLRIVLDVALREVRAERIAMFLRSDLHASRPRFALTIQSYCFRPVHSPYGRQRQGLKGPARGPTSSQLYRIHS